MAGDGASGERGSGEEQVGARAELTLQSTGLTLLGVLLSIGVTVGMGLTTLAWWLRLAIGGAVTVALVVAVGALGRRTSTLKRLADWMLGR